MAKRKRALTSTKIADRIKQGRGIGQGKAYQPWLTIQDVASRGQASRVLGAKTGRRHELLSLLEKQYFYILDLTSAIRDIREQYPLLPLESTQTIASELGIKHPADPHTGQDSVMTTDFVIAVCKNDRTIEVARTLKPSSIWLISGCWRSWRLNGSIGRRSRWIGGLSLSVISLNSIQTMPTAYIHICGLRM